MNRRVLVLLVASVLWTSLGCGGKKVPEEPSLKSLAVFYIQYVGRHQGAPPASEEDFKAFIKETPSEVLANLKIDNIDRLFISPRDNQPYVVVYSQAASGGGTSAQPVLGGPSGPGVVPGSGLPGPGGFSETIIAYEAVGAGGNRYIASNLGAVKLVGEGKFRELVPNAK